jgi:RNA polymerase sigma-70 factor (ECF subfamily)
MYIRAQALDDRTLVQRFKQTGDRDWFAALFVRHQERVYAICWALLRDRALAEEFVQETFMRAFKEISRFDETDPASDFATWLCAICRNLCRSELRRINRRRRQEAWALSQSDYNLPSPETVLTRRRVVEAIRSLDEGPRCCVLMFYEAGYTYDEIVRLTGYSFQEVKYYLRVGREQLRKMLT